MTSDSTILHLFETCINALVIIGYQITIRWFESEVIEVQFLGIYNCKRFTHAIHMCSTFASF